ncbi:MAG: serine/threonine protein kinase [Pseudanabaenales cyanobacterium]|nr:serine/threonine protein kinase [Pseudanabaenales cyanobacterium]
MPIYCLNPVCEKPQNPDNHTFCQNCGWRLRLGDRYQAIQPLGRGRNSKTFMGLDRQKIVQPRCLIKVLPPKGENHYAIEQAMERFRREVMQLDAIAEHPQIPDLLAYFERGRNQYLVQEFVVGQSLAQQLQENGIFSQAQICELLGNILPLLQFLHDHRLIHRNIKPHNLIRRPGEKGWVLADFGASKQVSQTALARTGTLVGSAEYAAPEQLMGKATFASDLYSLGVTCIHLLTGLSPFELFDGMTGRWFWRSVVTDVSDALATLLNRLLKPSEHDRYPSATAALKDLAEIWDIDQPAAEIAPIVSRLKETSKQGQRPVWRLQHNWTAEGALPFEVNAITLTPDGEMLAVGCNDGALQLWDMTGEPTLGHRVSGHSQSVSSIAISADGQSLVSGSWDGGVRLWRLEGKTAQLRQVLTGHTQPVTAVAIASDPPILISGGQDRTLKCWRLATGELIHTFLDHRAEVAAIALSADGQTLASGDTNGLLKLWRLATQELLRTLSGHRGRVGAIAFTCDSQILISTGWDTRLQLRNPKTGGLINPYTHMTGHLLPIGAIALSPDGQTIATGSYDTTIKLWSLPQGEPYATLTGHTEAVISLTFSPDSQTLISVSQTGQFRTWRRG